MDNELQLLTTSEFPQFFPREYGEMPECTFACGDGWHSIFHGLCVHIAQLELDTEFHILSVEVGLDGKMRIRSTRGKDNRIMIRCQECWSKNFYQEEIEEQEAEG